MRRIIVVASAFALALAFAGSAAAQDATMSTSLTPDAPGVGSKLHLEVSGAAPELAGAVPESLTLAVQRGFAVDVAAVAQRCDADHAAIGECPESSRVGSGQALVHASGLLTADVSATIAMFLAAPVESSDVASVVLRVDVGGQSRTVRARLVALPSGPVGYELRIAGIAAAMPTIPGIALELRSLVLDVGASRTVTTTVRKRKRVTRKGKRVTIVRKVKRTVRHDLVRNPKACPGSWGARVTIHVAGSDRVRELAIPCAAA